VDGVYSRITELDTAMGSAVLSAMEAIDGDLADLGKGVLPVTGADDAPEESRSGAVRWRVNQRVGSRDMAVLLWHRPFLPRKATLGESERTRSLLLP
jgi:hypothetical protein